MITNLRFPQEIIDSIQERVVFLEKCLNDANPEDEARAKMMELANNRQISIMELKEEAKKMLCMLHQFLKLNHVFKQQQNNLSILIFVISSFLYKEIMDKYWEFFLNNQGKKAVKAMTLSLVNLYCIDLKREVDLQFYQKDELYIIVETLKHLINSVIAVGLKLSILQEENIKEIISQNITPQESEVMLISLASTIKIEKQKKLHQNTVESLLDSLQTSSGWVGDDFEECLEYVNEVRRQ
jgi:hypothetical protein